MNRVMLGLLLAAGVALAWLWSEHQRQEEDRRLAEAVAKAVQLAATQVNPAYLDYERRYRRPPTGNFEAGLPPPEAWMLKGYDRVQLYPNGDVRFEFHRSGNAPYAFVWRSQALVPHGSVSCAVRGVPLRVLQQLHMSCNVELRVGDGSQSTDALPPVERPAPRPVDLVLEAVERDDAAALVQMKQEGGSLCEADVTGRMAIAEAVRGEQSKALAVLLDAGCPIDAVEPATGKTALMVASAAHRLDAVEVLLHRGADPSLVDATGASAWFLLGAGGYAHPGADLPVRQIMLDKGIGVDAVDAHGETLLMLAAASGSADLVQWLLAHGARLDAQDDTGRTPLMHAVTAAQGEKVLEPLIQKGANLKLEDRQGMNAMALASAIPDSARRQRIIWMLARH